ncbi:unnamed protein product [Schistosoma turkestanicum]|nr:unnamed protein product [Schistosoma turkestanicum]
MYQSNNTDNNTSHYCSDYAMGNCSLCNHNNNYNNNNNTNYGHEYLQAENDTNSNASFQNLYNMSNSLSYPLLSREFHSTLTTSNNSQNIISTDTMQSELPSNYVNNNHLLMNTIRDFGWPYFEKSTSAFSLCSHGKSNFSTSYRDCRLRYIKQTRKLQKYLRVTPEGHILVNNPKIEHHQHILHHNLQQSPSTYSYNHSKVNNTLECKDNFNKYSTTNHDLCNNPFGSLISTPKIKRIYTAFWNLEPRESITVHKLPSSKTISSFNQSTTTTTSSSSSSSVNHHQYTNGYNYYLNSNKDDDGDADEHDDDDDHDDEHDYNHPLESAMHNTTTSQKTLETLMEDSINDKLSDY